MNDTRPVFLDLMKIRFPAPAIASILHRISGVIIFIGLPFLIWALDYSLQSADEFMIVHAAMRSVVVMGALWVFLTAVVFHFLAGIRHMIMDFGFCESLIAGRVSAMVVMGLTVIGSLMVGIWLW